MQLRRTASTKTLRAAAGAIGLLILAGCARPPGPAPTSTPAPATPVPSVIETSTPAPIPGAIGFTAPAAAGPRLLDLEVMDPAHLDRLAPFQRLTAEGLPSALTQAGLAFYPSYEYQLAAQLDDGQLLVWDMATGEAIYRDQYASDDSTAGQHPALAIAPSFQRYLATSAGSPSAGTEAASGVVYRRPDEPQASTLLSAAGGPPGTGEVVRVLGLAYSPDGHLLAASLSGGKGSFIRIWDVWEQGAIQWIQQIGFEERAMALQFTPDGSALVSAVWNSLVYLDPTTGTELRRDALDFTILGLALGTSGDSWAAWGEQQAVLHLSGFPAALDLVAHDRFRRIEFSPDERLALAVDGSALRFWDLTSGAELTPHLAPADILDARILDNGRVLASIDVHKQVFLWGVPGEPAVPQTYARITPANAASVVRANGLYVPRALGTRLTAHADLLAAETAQGIYLAGVPNFESRRLLPLEDLSHTAFDLSADGAWLAWLAREGTVAIWNVRQDRLERELTGLGESCCWQVRFTPDGRYLATVADLTARVWYVPTGQQVYTVEGVQQVHISPDSTRMAFEQGLDVTIVDLASGRRDGFLTGFSTAAPVITTRFSPDWSAMYWAGRASMQFVEVQSGRLGPTADFSWGQFSPNGGEIVVVEDGWIYATVGQAHVLDVRTGETLLVLDHDEDAIIQAAAYSPDGRLIATGLGTTIKLWDATTGAELATLHPAGGAVQDLAFSPDQRMLLSMAGGEVVELWMVPEGGETEAGADVIGLESAGLLAPLDSLRLEEAATDAVFWPSGSSVAASTASGRIRYWDLASGETSEDLLRHGDWIYRLADTPSGLASVGKDGYLRLRASPQSFGRSVGTPPSELSALAFVPEEEWLAVSGEDGKLRFWNLELGPRVLEMQAHSAWVWGLAASPSGDLLATASADRTVKLWTVAGDASGVPQLSLLTTLTGHSETVWGVAFAPDGRTLASASWDRSVRLWDVEGGRQLRTLQGHQDWVYGLAFSPDGELLASSSADGTIRLWDPATGAALAVLQGSGRIWSVEFSPDGRYLVSASDAGDVVLWGVAP